MPLDAAFDTSTESALIDMAQRPRPAATRVPSFSMWGMLSAAPKGLEAGAAQGVASTADILGAFGQVMAATDARPGGMFSTGSQRTLSDLVTGSSEEERARKKMLEGLDFNSEAGRSFRNVARDFMPDPATSHMAEQAVANLFRVGGKAVAAGSLLGPLAGAGVAGAEEGFSTADDLGQQGVDLATRSKVGLLTAATTAAGLALPVAGTTWKGTVGLALAGGPGTFMIQNAGTREILKNADYSHLADQYDPLDPVGLTLSTLLPLGFGALAMRGGRAKSAVDSEAVDAARVAVLRESVDHTRPVPADDIAGAEAHQAAVSRAVDQMAAGERVEVSDVAPAAARITEAVGERMAPVVRAFEEEAKLRDPAPGVRAEPVEVAPATKAPEIEAAKPEGETESFKSESPELDRAVMDIEARAPDTLVHLDGMAEPVKLSELMARVRDEAKVDAAEGHLIEAAANCFLSG